MLILNHSFLFFLDGFVEVEGDATSLGISTGTFFEVKAKKKNNMTAKPPDPMKIFRISSIFILCNQESKALTKSFLMLKIQY